MEAQTEGKVLLVDKPLRWSSFDVVKKMRGILKEKKIGHAGTLDPLATGLLILCTGRMTKQINTFQEMDKEYTGTLLLGKTTPSFDLETEFDSDQDISQVTESDIRTTCDQFVGEITQYPPVYSAVRIGGVRSYKQARKGKEIKTRPRVVTVKEFSITSIRLPEVTFLVRCSKGTYIRSLIHDFGQALGVGACLTELRRTRIGDFSVEDARTIEQYSEAAE